MLGDAVVDLTPWCNHMSYYLEGTNVCPASYTKAKVSILGEICSPVYHIFAEPCLKNVLSLQDNIDPAKRQYPNLRTAASVSYIPQICLSWMTLTILGAPIYFFALQQTMPTPRSKPLDPWLYNKAFLSSRNYDIYIVTTTLLLHFWYLILIANPA